MPMCLASFVEASSEMSLSQNNALTVWQHLVMISVFIISLQYTRKVMIQYDSPGTAAYALRKLSGFEYPAGDKVQIKPNYDSVGNG